MAVAINLSSFYRNNIELLSGEWVMTLSQPLDCAVKAKRSLLMLQVLSISSPHTPWKGVASYNKQGRSLRPNSNYLLIKHEASHTSSVNSCHAAQIFPCGSPSYVPNPMYLVLVLLWSSILKIPVSAHMGGTWVNVCPVWEEKWCSYVSVILSSRNNAV
jgi:hypothetical protein